MAERHYWIILRQDSYFHGLEYVDGKKCAMWTKEIDKAQEFTSLTACQKELAYLLTRRLKLKNSIEIFKVVSYQPMTFRYVDCGAGLFVGQKLSDGKGVKKK